MRNTIRIGNVQQKILLLLFSGLALGFARTPRQSFKVIKNAAKEWRKLNNQQIKRSVTSLKNFGIVKTKKMEGGEMKIVLTEKGKKIAKRYSLASLRIKKPTRWDNKWRIVIFDIPERKRQLRDIFRHQLKQLGFYELQHSVWIHPYSCVGEIQYLIDFYKVPDYVHLLEASTLSNDKLFRNIFSLK
jgi:DNA-binding transcriptional regulator PaaX